MHIHRQALAERQLSGDERYAGAEPVLGWVAECSCGWRGPEYLAVLHPPADPLSGVAPPELDEAWWPAWDAHIQAVLATAYQRPASPAH